MNHPLMNRRLVILTLTGLLLLLFVVPFFLPWTPLNSSSQEVDITSGRLRLTRHLLFCKVSERIEESALSRTLGGIRIGGTEPRWYLVNTLSPGYHHSPHYIFHSAIGQIRQLELLWSSMTPPEEVKRRMAAHVLALWQHRKDDSLVHYYTMWLSSLEYDDGIDLGKSDLARKRLFQRLLATEITSRLENDGITTFTARYPDGSLMDQFQAYMDGKKQRVRHGVSTTWHSATQGEQAVFRNGEIVEPWKTVTRPKNHEWLTHAE